VSYFICKKHKTTVYTDIKHTLDHDIQVEKSHKIWEIVSVVSTENCERFCKYFTHQIWGFVSCFVITLHRYFLSRYSS
jgi:hypothetical protein